MTFTAWLKTLDREKVTGLLPMMFIGACVLSLFLLYSYPYTLLAPPENRVDLNGEWRMSVDDRPEFAHPDFDDHGWDTIILPGNFIRRALQKNSTRQGICWFRKTLTLENLAHGELGVSLGRIGNADEVFFNGERVGGMGQFPPSEFSMWNHPRNYRLPEHLVNFNGENTLAIRVSYFGIGEILGTMFITDSDTFFWYSAADTFTQVTMGYVSIAMGMALLLIFLFFYLRRTENQEYLFYCMQLIFGLPVVLEVCNYWNIYGNHQNRFILLGLAWVALNVAHPIFLHRIYNLKRVRIERFLWTYLVIIFFVAVVLTTREVLRIHGVILIVTATGVGFYNLSCHISALINKSPYAKTFSFFGITVVLCAIHDGLAYLSKFSGYQVHILGYEPSIMIFHVGAIVLYTGTALVLVNRFITVTDEVESLNESLENFILENSMLSEKLEQTLNKRPGVSISSLAEEKLKNVITYINENYLEEISREDLANNVGVHPDSLGKQFKKYTGRKLGDYIYELRVNEAARRLREEDTNVIDIAFEVGFESVRTFNRIFPKFMNTTPNNYRKIHQTNVDDDTND